MSKKIISFTLAILMCLSSTVIAYGDSVVDTPSTVTDEMCTASYWKNNNMYDSTELMLDASGIEAVNQAAIDGSNTYVFDLKESGKKTYDATATRLSRAGDASPFKKKVNGIYVDRDAYVDGEKIDNATYFGTMKQAILDTAYNDSTTRQTELAVATKYTALLAMPTNDVLGYTATDPDNEAQNSALVVNEPFIIRQKAVVDGTTFYFGYTTNMTGWVNADDLALFGSYESWLNNDGTFNTEKWQSDYDAWVAAWDFDLSGKDFVVVTQDKIILDSSYTSAYSSDVRLTLGTALKLVASEDKPTSIGERGTWNNYVVYLPTRNADGQYEAKMTLIPQHCSVNVGYVPYTQGNVMDLAFTCLGNRYGWSGMLNAYDCSLYVRTIYRCFGFELPRNTTYQLNVNYGNVQSKVDISAMTDEQKAEYISTLPVGTALYFSGHTMIYVGTVNGVNYVISALGSTSDPEGELNIKTEYSVALTPLTCRRSSGNTWLHDMKTAVVYNNVYDINDCDVTATPDGDSAKVCVKYNGTKLFEGINYTATVADGTATVTGIDANKTFTSSKTVNVCAEHTHCYTDYVSDGNATCTTDGTKTAVCDLCSQKNTVTDKGSALGHTVVVDNAVAATCTKTGLTEGSHCSKCGETLVAQQVTEKTAHNCNTYYYMATPTADGKEVQKCKDCEQLVSTTIINKVSNITVPSSYTYTGKGFYPTVTVKDSAGNTIPESNYKVTYTNNINVGTATATIKLSGVYTGTVTKNFKIVPKGTSVSKLTAQVGGFKVTWAKQTSSTTGYQIQYSTSSKFTSATTKTITKNSTTAATYTKLTKGKKYYVRVRTYKTVKGTKYCSAWSSAKTVTTKKK